MRLRTIRLVTGGFVAGLMILTLNAALPYYNAARQAETDAGVSRSYEVLSSVHALDIALLELETAQRGYLLTGIPAFKTTHERFQKEVRERYNNLKMLSGDHEQQQARLDRLSQLLESTLERFQVHIDTFDTDGMDAARAMITERRRHRASREIDQQMDEIQQTEETLLASRLRLAKSAADKTLLSFFIITSINILIFTALYYAVTRAFRKSQAAETALQEQSNLQSSILNSMSEGLGVVDAEGGLILFNPAAEQLLGQRLENVHLDQWPSAYGFYQSDKQTPIDWTELPLMKVLDGEPGRTIEIFLRHPHFGTERRLSMTARAIHDGNGHVQGGVAIFADITERKRHERVIQEANERLIRNISEMKRRNEEVNSLNELSGLLQSCNTLEEAVSLVARSAETLFLDFSGALYLMRSSKDCLELAEQWGEERSRVPIFTPQDCWCVRRSRLHQVKDGKRDIRCEHAKASAAESPYSICAPLTAQGEVLGVLYLVGKTAEQAAPETTNTLVTALCEQAGLALSNLKLRNTLRAQSDQDVLTGLHNRRFLDAALTRELARANRSKCPLSLLILDIDHFKKFNDNYGHDAGDAVLRAFAQTLRSVLRETDDACRYGGEEFVVLMPETGLGGAIECSERILEAVRQLSLTSADGRELGNFTASIGVAVSPADGKSAGSLLKAADVRLYQAKNAGRNRVVAAEIDSGMRSLG